MNVLELLLLAVGLSMDAFAVSVCKGLALQKIRFRHMLTVGLWFGCFQALMPLAGYLLASLFWDVIDRFDHWIAFGLLCLIGINMIREAFAPAESTDSALSFRAMLPLAIATSIDALAAGVSMTAMNLHIVPCVLLIGAVTFCFSCVGVKIGSIFGDRFSKKAQIAGGVILILLGCRVLMEHLSL